MTFCGYHPEMESGLETFGKGLAKAIRARRERLGIPMETTTHNTAPDMGPFFYPRPLSWNFLWISRRCESVMCV